MEPGWNPGFGIEKNGALEGRKGRFFSINSRSPTLNDMCGLSPGRAPDSDNAGIPGLAPWAFSFCSFGAVEGESVPPIQTEGLNLEIKQFAG